MSSIYLYWTLSSIFPVYIYTPVYVQYISILDYLQMNKNNVLPSLSAAKQRFITCCRSSRRSRRRRRRRLLHRSEALLGHIPLQPSRPGGIPRPQHEVASVVRLGLPQVPPLDHVVVPPTTTTITTTTTNGQPAAARRGVDRWRAAAEGSPVGGSSEGNLTPDRGAWIGGGRVGSRTTAATCISCGLAHFTSSCVGRHRSARHACFVRFLN